MYNKLSLFNSINNILMEWNPLSIEGPALSDEYISIIPQLIKIKENEYEIFEYLTNTVQAHYGVNASEDEIKEIAEKIFKINNLQRSSNN